MKIFNQGIVALFLCTLISPLAAAEYSESTFSRYDKSAWIAAGFSGGGLALGADFEYAADRTYGLGGMARFYQKDEDRGQDGYMVIGAFIRPHFHRRAWDLFITPGLAIVNVDDTGGNDATSLGPFMSYGVLYQFSETAAFGLDNSVYTIWFDDDYRGVVLEDVMFRARFSF